MLPLPLLENVKQLLVNNIIAEPDAWVGFETNLLDLKSKKIPIFFLCVDNSIITTKILLTNALGQ